MTPFNSMWRVYELKGFTVVSLNLSRSVIVSYIRLLVPHLHAVPVCCVLTLQISNDGAVIEAASGSKFVSCDGNYWSGY
jgi:hypothetical protein